MVTRTVVEKKVFDIKAHADMICGHGYCDKIPGLNWANCQEWVSDEECDRLLAEATADWEQRRNGNPWGTTSHKPELVIYWIPIEITP